MDIERLDSILVATLRHDGAHEPDATSGTWQDLIVWASPRRLLGRRFDVRGVGLLWDDPMSVPADERRYDAGIPIDEEDAGEVELPVRLLRTMPGDYMRVQHEGDYADLPATYASAIGMALLAEGMRLAAAPAIEVYRNSSAEVAVEDLRTDLYLPVVRA